MTGSDALERFEKQAAERLRRIYPAGQAITVLDQLLSEMQAFAEPSKKELVCRLWNEQDVILISYGDTICAEQQLPLQSLCTFLEQRFVRVLDSVVACL